MLPTLSALEDSSSDTGSSSLLFPFDYKKVYFLLTITMFKLQSVMGASLKKS